MGNRIARHISVIEADNVWHGMSGPEFRWLFDWLNEQQIDYRVDIDAHDWRRRRGGNRREFIRHKRYFLDIPSDADAAMLRMAYPEFYTASRKGVELEFSREPQ